jgi:hypothetical protein
MAKPRATSDVARLRAALAAAKKRTPLFKKPERVVLDLDPAAIFELQRRIATVQSQWAGELSVIAVLDEASAMIAALADARMALIEENGKLRSENNAWDCIFGPRADEIRAIFRG